MEGGQIMVVSYSSTGVRFEPIRSTASLDLESWDFMQTIWVDFNLAGLIV